MKPPIKITVDNPCHEDWAKMTPTEKGRHCLACTKEVIDFTKYTDEQLYKTATSDSNICGRFLKEQLDRDIQISRKKGNSWIQYAASLLIPAAILSTQEIKAQGTTPTTEQIDSTYTNLGISSLSRKQNKQDSLKKQETRIIKGIVTEESGPLPGAGIFVKGTEKGTNTDFDGMYEIEVSPGDVLVFSYVGYTTHEVIVKEQKIINPILSYDGSLCELIIMGNLRVKNHSNASNSLTPIKPLVQTTDSLENRTQEIATQKEHWKKVKAYKKYKQEQRKAVRLRKKRK